MNSMSQHRIERGSPLPLYHQLKRILLDEIDQGRWKPGELMPGELELQDTYGLSRSTVRQAMRELEFEGRIARQRGRGTFVAPPKLAHSPEPTGSLTDTLEGRGIKPAWRLLSIGDELPPREVAEHLEVSGDATLLCVRRLRLADDEPIGIHVAHVAPAFRHLVDEGRLSLGRSLDYLNVGRALDGSRAERVLDAVAASDTDAGALGIETGTPLLRVRRTVVAKEGKPIEHLSAVYRGDRFEYRISSVGRVSFSAAGDEEHESLATNMGSSER